VQNKCNRQIKAGKEVVTVSYTLIFKCERVHFKGGDIIKVYYLSKKRYVA
jgi:hypothetical protein